MFNRLIMIGNLTRDIELRYTQVGAAIAKSAIATSYKYKVNGEKKEEVCYLDFVIFGRSAEIANQYLKKGSKVLLEGRLVFEQWTSQSGEKKSKHTFRVDTLKMFDSNNSTQPQEPDYIAEQQQSQCGYNQQPNQYQQQMGQQYQSNVPDIDEEEIPF